MTAAVWVRIDVPRRRASHWPHRAFDAKDLTSAVERLRATISQYSPPATRPSRR